MQILIDACLALLASIGLWALSKVVIGRFIWDDEINCLMTIIGVAGDCEHIERVLKKRLIDTFCPVLLVDCGLTDVGTAKINNILEHYSNVSVCMFDELPNEMKEAKRWKKQENTIK